MQTTRQIGVFSAIVVVIAVAGIMEFYTEGLNQDIKILENPYAMDVSTVYTKLQENEIFLVDIRDEQEYVTGHIPGSAIDHLYGEILEKRVNTMQNRLPDVASTAKIVLVDEDGSKTSQIAQSMSESGIETYYLDGGIDNWNKELATTSITKQIDAKQLWKQIQQNKDIYLLDVRQPEELEVTQISTSVNIPLPEIFSSNQIDQIPDDKPVIVICGSGNRATIATYALALEGIDFQVLDGGIKAWDMFLEENNLESI